MSVETLADVSFGEALPRFDPDTRLETVTRFAHAVGWGGARFEDHGEARAEGFPGAIVPGIMSMGFLTAMIHRWAPAARVRQIDTVFRAPVVADEPCHIDAVVTDIDEDAGEIELDLSVKNEAGETRVFGTARVALPRD